MEEFRKVGQQKKELQEKSRARRKEIRRIRQKRLLAHAALLEAQQDLARADAELVNEEEEDIKLNDSLAALEDKSRRMLQREMLALGVFDSVTASSGPDHEVALAEPEFVFDGQFGADPIDWEQALEPFDGTGPPVSG
jgi:hypothetical protein